jgi:hypothetical protein
VAEAGVSVSVGEDRLPRLGVEEPKPGRVDLEVERSTFHGGRARIETSAQDAGELDRAVIAGGLLPWQGCELEIPTGPGIGVELDGERVAHFAALYEREVRGRVLPAPSDEFYERQYLIRPRS